MTIQFDCKDCGKSLRVKDEKAGRKTRCPACNAVMTIPELDADDEGLGDDLLDERPTPAKKRSTSSTNVRQSSRSEEGDGTDPWPERKKKKSSKQDTPIAEEGGIPAWAVVVGCCALAVLSIGVGGVLGMNFGYGARSKTAVAESSEAGGGEGAAAADKAPAAKQGPQFVSTETVSDIGKFKMKWEMPPKWTQESELEDGVWPWFHMKGQGQEIRLASNRSLTETATTMTSIGGFKDRLMTAHSIRVAKLEAEYTDYVETKPQFYQGKKCLVVWSDYEYKGVFSKGYGIRCTIPGARLPCSLKMECSQSARDKWRPIIQYVAGTVSFESIKKKKPDDKGVPAVDGAPADDDAAMADEGEDEPQ